MVAGAAGLSGVLAVFASSDRDLWVGLIVILAAVKLPLPTFFAEPG